MSWEIKYTSKYTGKTETHVNTNNESDARGWAKSLAESNGCKAECTHVVDGPYDRSGKRTHVVSEGSDN